MPAVPGDVVGIVIQVGVLAAFTLPAVIVAEGSVVAGSSRTRLPLVVQAKNLPRKRPS